MSATTCETAAQVLEQLMDDNDGNMQLGWWNWYGSQDEFVAKYPMLNFKIIETARSVMRRGSIRNESTEARRLRENKMIHEIVRSKVLYCAKATLRQKQVFMLSDFSLPREQSKILEELFPAMPNGFWWPNRKRMANADGTGAEESDEHLALRVAAHEAEIVSRRKQYLDPAYYASMRGAASSKNDYKWEYDAKLLPLVYPGWDTQRFGATFVKARNFRHDEETHAQERQHECNRVSHAKRCYIKEWYLKTKGEAVNVQDIDVGKWEKERAAPLLLPEGRKIGEKQKRDDADPAAASS